MLKRKKKKFRYVQNESQTHYVFYRPPPPFSIEFSTFKYSRTAAGPLLAALRKEVVIFILTELLTNASFPVSLPWRDAET